MTSAQVVGMSVTNNSSFQNYSHPDDHTIRTIDTPSGSNHLQRKLNYHVYSFLLFVSSMLHNQSELGPTGFSRGMQRLLVESRVLTNMIV